MKALGIDLGTTKVAAVVYDENSNVTAAAGAAHNAAVENTPSGVFEQDVKKIIECVHSVVQQLPEALRAEVSVIGITGQMHSILLKNSGGTSNLITWQDHRCGAELIDSFNKISKLQLREGFGGTTLARMAYEKNLQQYTQAANICDYLGSVLTGNDYIITDPTFAASWGIFDAAKQNWDFPAIEALNIPQSILPEIKPCGTVIGRLTAEYSQLLKLPENTPVTNSIGDNQASILGTGKNLESEIFLTLGTGAQLSLVTDDFSGSLPENIEIRPFPGNRKLLVSAPLCGGAAFAFLADTVNRFYTALGGQAMNRNELMDKLDDLAMEYITCYGEPDIEIKPHFLGERHAPDLRGSVENLTLHNATPGALAAALAWGIVRNLKQGFPPEAFAGRQVVIGSGNAVRLVKSIRHAIVQEFKLDLELPEQSEEAACGAAKLALSAIR